METKISGSIDSFIQEGSPLVDLLENIKADNPPWGIIMFEQDGSVSSLCASEEIIGEENSKHIMMAMDFAHYAFERPDWMVEYVKNLKIKKEELQETAPRPELKLIKGGLLDED